MAITIANGFLGRGGVVVEASDGTKIAVFIASDYSTLYVYKDIDGTPALVDSDTVATIHGGGNIYNIDAAIDSNDDIHIVSSCDAEQTRDVAYAICDLTTGFGAWEQAADYTEQAPTTPGCAISIDSNDYPHILFVDNVKMTGAAGDNVYYNYNDGSWSGAEQVGLRTVKTWAYNSPKLTLAAANDVEAFYYRSDTGDPAYRRRNGTWSGESYYTETDAVIGEVVITTGDTVYRYHTDTDEDIEENDVDTTYNAGITSNRVSATLVNDSDRYVFYIDTSDDVHVISNDGGGWTDESAQQAGTYLRVISEWAYNNENQSGEINYIFDDGTNVYYDSFSLGADPEISKSESVTVTENTEASIPINISGVSDNITATEDVGLAGGVNPDVSDSVTVTESVDADVLAVPTLNITGVSDSTTVSENVDVDGGVNPSASDNVAVVDIAHYYDNNIIVTEDVDAEVVEPPAPDRDVDVSDSTTVTEYAEAYVQPTADIDVSVDEEDIVVSENATIEDVPNIDVEEDQSIAVTEYWDVTVLAVVDRDISKSESITVTENVDASVEATADVNISNISESITVTENVDASIPAVADLDIAGISDSTTVTESVSVEDIANPDVSDNVTVTENVALECALDIDVNDSITVTENVDAELSVEGDLEITGVLDNIVVSENVDVDDIANPDVSDSVTVTENVEASVSDPQISVQDSTTVTENVEVEDIANPDVSDSIGVSEFVSVSFILEIDKQESVTVTENVSVEDIANPIVSDSVTVTEYVEFFVSDPAVLVQDSLTVTENVVLGGIPNINVQENISVTENVDVYYPVLGALAVSVSDDVTVTENVAVGHIPNPDVSDNISVTENVDLDVIELTPLDAIASDSTGVTDSASAEIALGVFADENVSVTENVEAAVSASQISVSDSVTVTENVEVGGLPNISVQDSVTVTENVDTYYPELGSISLSVSDNISVAENVVAQVGIEIVVLDNISVAEDVTVYVQPIPPPALGIFISPDNVDSYAVGIKVYA